jgi:hypothetical protein
LKWRHTGLGRPGSIASLEAATKTGLVTSYHEMPGAWFIWRQFLIEFAPLLFK